MWGTCFTLAVLGWLLHASRGGQTLHTVQTCTNSTSAPLKLICETGEIIHVVSVQYQNMTGSCEPPPGGSCVFLQATQADSLYTECNGVATCEMEVHKFWMDTVCGDTTNYKAVITYECVPDDVIDVCNNVTHVSKQNRIYLASPHYPSGTNLSSGRCSCDVTGANMNVTILEYYFLPLDGVRANLTLTGDTSTWESFTAGMIAYNSLVMESTGSLKIVFDAIPTPAKKKEVMWLKVEGSPVNQIVCNGSPPPLSPTSGTTDKTTQDTGLYSSLSTSNTTVASSSPGKPQGRPDTASNTVAVAVGCVFAVIVIAAVVIIVIFILLRRKRLKHYLSSSEKPSNGHKEDEAHEMPRYVTDVPYCTPADHRPPSAEYAELQGDRAIKVDNVKVSMANSDGKDQSSIISGSPGSTVPYTSKRLEELYAKVIPRKFRSTKTRDEEKDKSVRHESVGHESGRDDLVRDESGRDELGRNSVHAYDNATVDQVTNQRPVSKGGRHVSEPDYQEIGEASLHTTHPQRVQDPNALPPLSQLPSSPPSDQSHPVPETSGGSRRDVKGIKADQKKRTKEKSERSKSTHNGVSPKERKKKKGKGKISKSKKERSKIQHEEHEIPSLHTESSVDPSSASTSPSTDIKDDVMVDNVLYEGGPAEGQHTGCSGDQRPQSQHYEDMRTDIQSTHVNIDMNRGQPPHYEEVTI